MIDRTFALVVAVENYNNKDAYSKVHYAKKDAECFVNSLINQGVPKENIISLEDGFATKTSIITELENLTSYLTENDRAIFYFAGHGAYLNSGNYIVPVDGYKLMAESTCISIDFILGKFKKSKCKRNLLFLDCCHSGFKPGNTDRGIDDTFMADDLKLKFRNEEYCVGFASCSSNQASHSNVKLGNGIWTHFLVKAMNGEVKELYQDGILFSNELQSYLNKTVSEYARLHTEEKVTQIPIMFGSATDRFIVADLNPIFEKARQEEEKNAQSFDIGLNKVSIVGYDSEKIRNLPGFRTGHRVPTEYSNATNSFVKKIGEELLSNDASELSKEIKNELGYKRTEISVQSEIGERIILTPDFNYYITLSQEENDPTLYIIQREVTEIVNPLILGSEGFNSVFKKLFDRLVFRFSNRIDIEELIDKIENLPNESNLKVDYDPSDLSECTLKIDKLNYFIKVDSNQISIVSDYRIEPRSLIEAFKEVRKAISLNKEIKFLN